MSEYDDSAFARELKREALMLIQRERSDGLAPGELDALVRWRASSPAHERAFVDALRFQAALRSVVKEAPAPAPAVGRGPWERMAKPSASSAWGRRAFIGGAIAASGAYLLVRPPVHLWPSLAELTADYHTHTGERRQVAVNKNVALDLNTQTSVALSGSGAELISGELAATVRSGATFAIAASSGRILAAAARVDVRRDKASVCVTCLEGEVRVEHPAQSLRLPAGQQVIYTHQDMGAAFPTDASAVTAWRRGVLVFRDTPLRQVLDELNRYRSGRLVLANAALAERPVLGVFEIDHIDQVVGQIQRLSGARVTQLPGRIVIFS